VHVAAETRLLGRVGRAAVAHERVERESGERAELAEPLQVLAAAEGDLLAAAGAGNQLAEVRVPDREVAAQEAGVAAARAARPGRRLRQRLDRKLRQHLADAH